MYLIWFKNHVPMEVISILIIFIYNQTLNICFFKSFLLVFLSHIYAGGNDNILMKVSKFKIHQD